jgi:lantibiotic modifying enzyme
LSRTRWLQLTGHADARRDLERGLRTTLRWLGDPDVIASASYTLCHGQLGAAACALAAAEALGDAEGRVAALATAARGLAAHGHDPSAWASGVRRGPHPSLMLGQAGIGHFYLRLASSATPSVLRWSPR